MDGIVSNQLTTVIEHCQVTRPFCCDDYRTILELPGAVNSMEC